MNQENTKANQEETKPDEVWPPAPRQEAGFLSSDKHTVEKHKVDYLSSVVIYVLCLFTTFFYWYLGWYILRSVADALFPSTTVVQRVYGPDIVDAVFGLLAILMLTRRKSKFRKPLLIGLLLAALPWIVLNYTTQNMWQ